MSFGLLTINAKERSPLFRETKKLIANQTLHFIFVSSFMRHASLLRRAAR
jgi:hypothetical protein